MSLFQKVIVKKYLKNLPSDLIEENYKKYTKYFNDFGRAERIRALKEEQYQEGFLRELFVECLNYTINPDKNFNLTTEFKNKTDAEKADGAILKDGKPIAVIELKSTRTKDLKSIEKQAFNYKAHQPNCKYVITSNFEKIRLYINDAIEFEEFNVFGLSENEFKFLYLCLSKESIFEDIPAEMKEKSNQHEELISKKLYNDYSIFRNSIFQNLTKNNPQIDKLLLFKKAQKLLDRFLFIFFAEDKGLIPPNIISKIIDDYNKLKDLDVYTPLYTIFKKYFSYINKGYEKLSIDAYNGGLFQFDEILDNVEIDDEILITDSLKLSNYDFDSEIDVNILGHIFEHSLTDIEKLNAEILAAKGDTPLLDKKQTRRKKEGVFYTPNYITKYIVENTVGTLCAEKKDELELNNIAVDETYFKKAKTTNSALSKKGEQLYDKLENYKEWLLSLKILDPACGSGAFLNQALNFLIDEHNFIINLETDLRMGQLIIFDIDTAVLENNLYGVDINEESVEIAKLSLWLKTAQKGRRLTDLSKHIKCGNSLIDDLEIAGEKAFDWHKEFPQVFTIKEKKTWHITTATHNSRYSQRMFDNHVKLGEPVWLTENEEMIITETIAEIIEEDKLNIPAYNICGDHMHMILVCEEDEMPKIVGKIKAVSARKCNIEKGITVPATNETLSTSVATVTREHVPLSGTGSEKDGILSPPETSGTRGHVPSETESGKDGILSSPELSGTRGHAPSETESEKDGILSPPELAGTRGHVPLSSANSPKKTNKYNSLWTQKFGRKEIVTDEQLNNTLNYIRNNRKKHELPENKKLNAIIDTMTCTIDHAFRLEYKGGFDVVIGNPPYVSFYSRQAVFVPNKMREFYSDNYEIMENKRSRMNTLSLFLEKSVNLLSKKGKLGFIIDKTILIEKNSIPLRKFLINNVKINKILPNLKNVFEITVDPTILLFTNQKVLDYQFEIVLNENFNTKLNIKKVNINEINKPEYVLYKQGMDSKIDFNKIFKECKHLKDVAILKSGANIGGNKEFFISKTKLNEKYKPVLKGSKNVGRYILLDSEHDFLNYDHNLQYKINKEAEKNLGKNKKVNLVKLGDGHIDHRYEKPKIIIRQSSDKFTAIFDEQKYYCLYGLFIINQLDLEVNLKYLLALINSKLYTYYGLASNTILTGHQKQPQIRAKGLKELPIKQISLEAQISFIEKADIMLSMNKEKQEKINKFLHRLETNFEIEKFSNKMKAFYDYDFKTLITELKKKKIKLTLSQQDEWEDYFNSYKEEILKLQNQISQTDKEIDQMVYELYGLTKEEIEIVENK